jgi:hypothetical protein
VLAKQELTLRQVNKTRWDVTPAWKLRTPQANDILFDVHLTFADGDKLALVTMYLHGHNPAAYSDALQQVFDRAETATLLYQLLSTKYGTPTSQDPTCANVSGSDLLGSVPSNSRFARCDALWTAKGQSVKLGWAYYKTQLNLEIDYAATQSAGL